MSLRFLQELFRPYPLDEGQLCEIRCIDREGVAAVRYFGLHKLERAAAFAQEQARSTNVYFGVLPRFVKEAGGGSGRDAHVDRASWLWCDIDRGDAAQSEVVEFLRSRFVDMPRPRLIVLSGSGGVHLYFRLARVHPMASARERDEFKMLLRRLVLHLGHGAGNLRADASCVNVSRILRLPRTFNHKHDPPALVQGALCEEAPDLTIQEWSDLLPFLPLPSRQLRPPFAAGKTREGSDPPSGLRRWAETGYPEGNRHHDLVGAAAFLRRSTDLPEPIAYSLLMEKARNSPGRRPITEQEIEHAWKWAGG